MASKKSKYSKLKLLGVNVRAAIVWDGKEMHLLLPKDFEGKQTAGELCLMDAFDRLKKKSYRNRRAKTVLRDIQFDLSERTDTYSRFLYH